MVSLLQCPGAPSPPLDIRVGVCVQQSEMFFIILVLLHLPQSYKIIKILPEATSVNLE